MEYNEIKNMLEETKLPVAYWLFDEENPPTAPYIIFSLPDSSNFAADGGVYHKANRLVIELFTPGKSPEVEELLENKLDENGLVYDRREYYIEDEKLFQEVYELEV